MRSFEINTYEMESAEGFRSLIAQLDVALPDRSDSNWKDLSEKYLMARVLHCLDNAELFFPMRLVHADRPDFQLRMPSREVGIELVEATSTNVLRKNLLRSSETNLSTYFVEPGIPGESVKSASALRAELEQEVDADTNGEVIGDGSVGPPWPEWGRAIAHVVEKKVITASKPGFQRFSENWLAIYDNWPIVMTTPKPDRMMEALRMELPVNCFTTFDRIYIVSNQLLFEMDANGERFTNELDRSPRPTLVDNMVLWLWGWYERFLLWKDANK